MKNILKRILGGAAVVGLPLISLGFSPTALADTILAAAVLPGSRSVQVNDPATLFVTIINGGAEVASNCRIEADNRVPLTLSYQTTDAATNLVTGSADTPVSLDPGAAQSFLIVLTPTSTIAPTEVQLGFLCDNAPVVPAISGVNTFEFSASSSPVADIVALGLTPSADGIVAVPTTSRINAFSVASVNLGAAANVQVEAVLSNSQLAATLSICETDPQSGACINPTVPSEEPVVTQIASMATPTFAVFVTTTESLAFDPATSRISVRFSDETEAVRGATSVALSSRQLEPLSVDALQGTTLWSSIPQPGFLIQRAYGQTFEDDGTGVNYERSLSFADEIPAGGFGQPFTWSLNAASELIQQFQDYVVTENVPDQGNFDALATVYGLPPEPIAFLRSRADQGQFVFPLEVERGVVSRLTTANAEAGDDFEVTIETTQRYSIDKTLERNGWTEPFPQGSLIKTSTTEYLAPATQLALAEGQVAASGETWVVPFVFEPLDPAVTETPAGFYADALTLREDGTTTTGRLSGKSFSWQNLNNVLVLTSGDEEYRYTTTATLAGERVALIEYFVGGQSQLVVGREIALADETGVALAADLVNSGSLYWQAGISVWARESFDANGVMLPNQVFGYQFLDGTSANRIFNSVAGSSDCIDETLGCFVPTGEDWTWSSQDNFINRSLVNESRDRTRIWEVISYVPGRGAVVLESEIFSFQGDPFFFLITPRLNKLTLTDLETWPAEFANSPGFN